MSFTLAQKLLQQYMRKIEATSNVYDLIDLFSDSKAKAAIKDALTASPAISGPRANQFPGVRQIIAMVNEET